jgi:hypothetical protein
MERMVRGRPGRLGRDLEAWRRARMSRSAALSLAGLWPDQQPEPAKHVPWEAVQQCGQERPVARAEPRPGRAQLPLQHRDLVA